MGNWLTGGASNSEKQNDGRNDGNTTKTVNKPKTPMKQPLEKSAPKAGVNIPPVQKNVNNILVVPEVEISESEASQYPQYNGQLTSFQAEDKITLMQKESLGSQVWVLYRQTPDEGAFLMMAFHVMPGDYYGHVPVKARFTEPDRKKIYYADTLPNENFETIDALAKRQLEKGDPDGCPFATCIESMVAEIASQIKESKGNNRNNFDHY